MTDQADESVASGVFDEEPSPQASPTSLNTTVRADDAGSDGITPVASPAQEGGDVEDNVDAIAPVSTLQSSPKRHARASPARKASPKSRVKVRACGRRAAVARLSGLGRISCSARVALRLPLPCLAPRR